jgi:hypothetical protein
MEDREQRQRVVRLTTGFHPADEFMAAIKREDKVVMRMDRAVRLDDGTDDVFGGETAAVSHLLGEDRMTFELVSLLRLIVGASTPGVLK